MAILKSYLSDSISLYVQLDKFIAFNFKSLKQHLLKLIQSKKI